jgi:transglutaminase-like putative cysteine protease/uncharacterized protein (DUF58 family)
VLGCGVAFGLTAGASLVFIAVAALATAFAMGVVLAVTGAARATVVMIDGPDVAIAGEPVQLLVTSVTPRRVVIEVGDGPHVVARWSPPLGRHRVAVEATFHRRALHSGLAVTVRCAGPFGVWWWLHRIGTDSVHTRRHTVGLVRPLMVGPAVIPCAAPTTGGEAGDGRAPTVAGRHQEPGAFHAIRPWSDGDSISWVHWPSALRTGELLVREWEPPALERVEIVVDRCADPEEAERVTGRAAGEVEAALRAGRSVRLTVPTVGRAGVPVPVTDRWTSAAVLAAADLPLQSPEATPRFRAPPHERRLLPRALSVAALWLAAGAVLGALGWPPVTTTLTLLGLPAVAVLVHVTGARRPGVMRALGLVVVVAAVARFSTGFGDTSTASLGTLRDPLVELLLGLATAHAASTLERRSLRFSLGIAAALAFYAGAVRVDPAAAWWLAGWFVTTVLALAAIHRSELRSLAPVDQSFPPADVRTVAVRSGWSVVGIAGAIAVALAVLAVVPIPAGPVQFVAPSALPLRSPVPKPAALGARDSNGNVVVSGTGAGGADDPATAAAFGYPAFEQTFDLSARGRPSQEVIMRVRAPAPDFWRGQTFERFDGRRWYVSDDKGLFVNGPIVPIGRLDGDVLAPTDDLLQTYYIERDVPNLVFAAQRPVLLYLDAGVWVRPDGALRADTTLPAGTVYTVQSRRSEATDDSLRAQGGPASGPLEARWKSPARARYLQLPDTTTARTRDLAHTITDPYPDVYDKIRAIERWFAANVQYDLDAPVPPAGADAVDHFLFESRRGFCEQISTALVVMLRSIGVPAREAAGYAAGQRDPIAGVWVVRGEDAHAWAEVWFPATGWQAFDPTALVPLAGDSAGRASLGAPIARAIGRGVGRIAPYAVVPVAVAAAAWPLLLWLGRRRRARLSPAWAAQRRFERACGRVGVAVGQADSNERLAARVADRAPPAAVAAAQAGTAIDHVVFGAGDPDAATAAVATLEKVLSARP